MDVAAWLRGLGLEQYAAAFREHGVDADVLPDLTADDLNDLGVTAVGHRRKLLRAIADLHNAALSMALGIWSSRTLRDGGGPWSGRWAHKRNMRAAPIPE